MLCPSCGSQIAENSSRCPNCGNVFENQTTVLTPEMLQQYQQYQDPSQYQQQQQYQQQYQDPSQNQQYQQQYQDPSQYQQQYQDPSQYQQQYQDPSQYQQQYQDPSQYQQQYQDPSQYQQYQYPNSQYQQYQQAPAPKKKGKLVGVLVAVIALIAVCAVAVFGFGSSLLVRFSSPEKQQLYAYSKIADTAAEKYGTLIAPVTDSDSTAVSGAFTVSVSETTKALVSGMGVDISGMDNISIGYDLDATSDMVSVKLSASYNGSELISGEAVVDINNKIITAYLPDLNSQPLKIDISEMTGTELPDVSTKAVKDMLPTAKLVEKLLPKYIEAALKQVTGVKKSSEALSVNGLEQKSTKYTSEFTEKILANVIIAVSNQLKTDADLKEYIISTVNSVNSVQDTGMTGQEAYDEFISSLDEGIAAIEQATPGEDVLFTLNTWVDSSFDIIGIEVQYGDSTFFAGGATSNGKVEAKVSALMGSEEYFNVTFSGTEVRDVYTGDVTAYMQGEQLFAASCTDVSLKDNCFNGKVTITSDAIAENIGSELASLAEITLEGKTEDKKHTLILSVGKGDTSLVSIAFDYTKDKVEAPALHSNAAENMDEWTAAIDTQALMTKLTESGIMDIIQPIITQAMSSVAYDDDMYYYDDDYDFDSEYEFDLD